MEILTIDRAGPGPDADTGSAATGLPCRQPIRHRAHAIDELERRGHRELVDIAECERDVRLAAAHGWLDEPPLARERDRLCGMIYGLQRRG